MTVIVNTKIGECRGRKRVWLEGNKLANEGWDIGERYSIELMGTSIRLKASVNGKYIVSRKKRNEREFPIIDLTVNEVAALFGEIQQLRVLIRKGVIVISAHHQHQNVVNRVERFLTKVKNGEPLNVASLFHGGGILDASAHAGMSAAGIKSRIAVAVEVEDKYLESSMACNKKLWDSDSIAINSPIELVELNRGKPTDIQCLIGGIPCTGASLAGRAKNKLARAEDHSSAGALFFYFLEFARVLNPAVVVIENVEAYANTASMSVIRSVLNSLGYHVQETVLDGAQWVLERRKRLAVVAISEGLDVDFDINDIQPTRTKESSISDILEDIPLASDRWKPFEYLAIKEAADKAAGKGFARQLLSSDADGCGVIGRSYAKCRSTEPFLKHSQDESLSRLFTPLEHCRLKGCPEYLIEGLSDTLAHEILGQSIVFPAFKDLFICLGKSIQRFVDRCAVVDDGVESAVMPAEGVRLFSSSAILRQVPAIHDFHVSH